MFNTRCLVLALTLSLSSLVAGCLETTQPGEEPNHGCTPESDQSVCARTGNNCGAFSATDNCGFERVIASCGLCAPDETCGGAGTENVCGKPGGTNSTAENTDALCSDGISNDGDRFVDCDDFDCSQNPKVTVCRSSGVENTNALCSDGVSNDGDRFVDCDDFDCSDNPAVTVCGDGPVGSTPSETLLPIRKLPALTRLQLTEVIALESAQTGDGKYLVTGQASSYVASSRAFIARVKVDGTLDSTFGEGGVVVPTDVNCGGAESSALARTSTNTFVSFRCGLWSVDHVSGAVSFLDDSVYGRPVASDGQAAYFYRSLPADPSDPLTVRAAFVIERWISATQKDPTYGEGGAFSSAAIDSMLDRTSNLFIDGDARGLVFAGSRFSGGGRVIVARVTADGALDTAFGVDGFASDSVTYQNGDAPVGVATTSKGISVLVDGYDDHPIRLVTFTGNGTSPATSTMGPDLVRSGFIEGRGEDGTVGMRGFLEPHGQTAIVVARPTTGGSYRMTILEGGGAAAGFFVEGQNFTAFGNRNLSTTPEVVIIRGRLP